MKLTWLKTLMNELPTNNEMSPENVTNEEFDNYVKAYILDIIGERLMSNMIRNFFHKMYLPLPEDLNLVPIYNWVHMSTSMVTSCQAYLITLTNSHSYSATFMFYCFNLINSLFFLRYRWLTYFFLNSVCKKPQFTLSQGVMVVKVTHHLYISSLSKETTYLKQSSGMH